MVDKSIKSIKRIAVLNLSVIVLISVFLVFFMLTKNDVEIGELENFNRRISRTYGLLEQTKRTSLLETKIKRIIEGTTYRKKMEYELRNNSYIKKDDDVKIIADEIYVGEYIYNISEEIIFALFSSESYWSPKARNKTTGASGLGQQMPGTFDFINVEKLDIYSKQNIMDIRANVRASIRTWHWVRNRLRDGLDREPTLREISWGYNAGPENVINFFVPDPDSIWNEPKEYGEKMVWYMEQYREGNFIGYWEVDVKRKKYLELKEKRRKQAEMENGK